MWSFMIQLKHVFMIGISGNADERNELGRNRFENN